MNKKIKFALIAIIILAAVLRIYKVGEVPPSLSWDETAVGYNAYTIANWGRDEWGYSFPAFFRSFGDDKNPVHVYLTAVSVKFLGLSEFSTRLPMAILGVLNVLLIFYLGRLLFSSNVVGLLGALILSVSPYNLQFSRFNHEANPALFFFMLGLLLFLKAVKQKSWFLPLAFFSFGVSVISYHSSKLVVPLMVIVLSVLYFKQLWKFKRQILSSVLVILLFAFLFITNPQLLGSARASQSTVSQKDIESTEAFKRTNNLFLGRLDITWQRYKTYFTPTYLFESGDAIARHSAQAVGEFYKVDSIFLLIGLLSLLILKTRSSIIVLTWALIAPLPASVGGGPTETAHAARALFTMGSWHLIIAFGLYSILKVLKIKILQIILVGVFLSILGWEIKNYLNYYYGEYVKRYAIEWQYGLKQAAEYVKDHNGYSQVYVTDARMQPYIFFLYHLKTPLPEYLKTMEFNETPSRPSSLVIFFDKYHFGDWDPIESFPNMGVLYVVTPSQYDGLRYKNMLSVKKLVKYPNGADAFYLVSYP